MKAARLRKLRERLFVEETAQLLGAEWAIVEEREEPDFVLECDGCRFGLEVVEAFVDPPSRSGSAMREREGRNQATLQRIRRRWESGGGRSLNIKVSLGGRRDLKDADTDDILKALLQNGANMMKNIDDYRQIRTDCGSKIFVYPTPFSRWIHIGDTGGWVFQNAVDQIQCSINAKQSKLNIYQSNICKDIRLLVVADHHRASGMLYLKTSDRIDPMGFTHVYFLPHPGGPVSVITPPTA